eukprot:CAMPEP_0184293798 /NCGR_PEP_ID=MMETSP1049-20130417/5139_1 /TAXON_ID=77928 /ORGANISM="Proteomonas sulcata, Strain CCMP704" /LENGTH=74 /DNA_ID=CAMNT_0026601871 /DNA_START=591 /DNA_END=815 /DNA_ORIENTATION=+
MNHPHPIRIQSPKILPQQGQSRRVSLHSQDHPVRCQGRGEDLACFVSRTSAGVDDKLKLPFDTRSGADQRMYGE